MISRSHIRTALVLGLLSGWASAASAQGQPVSPTGQPFDPRKDARIHAGPFDVTPTLTLENLGVDTNVFNSTTDPKSDFTFTFAPKLQIWLPVQKRALFSTSVTSALVYFEKYSSERSVDPDVSVRGDVFLRHLTFFGEGEFLRSRARPSFEIDARSEHVEKGGSAGFGIEVAPKLSLILSGYDKKIDYNQDAVFFGTSLQQTLNHTEEGLRAEVRDQLTSLTTVSVKAETIKQRFDFSPLRNSDGFKIGGAAAFKPKALISGNAEIGIRKFTGVDPQLPDYTGVYASAGLSYTLLTLTKFGFNWSRDVAYSYQVDLPYYILNDVGGTVRRQIRGNFDAIVGADRGTYHYRSFGAVQTSTPGNATTTYTVDVGYRVNRLSRMGFAVSKSTRASNILGTPDYRGFRAGLSLIYGL